MSIPFIDKFLVSVVLPNFRAFFKMNLSRADSELSWEVKAFILLLFFDYKVNLFDNRVFAVFFDFFRVTVFKLKDRSAILDNS